MKIFIRILILIVSLTPASAQQQVIDSLRHQLEITRNDTVRLMQYSDLAEAFSETRPDSAHYYGEQLLILARKLDLPLNQTYALRQMGYALLNMGNYPRSLQAFLSGIEIAADPGSEKNILPDRYPDADDFYSHSPSARNKRLNKLARLYQYVGILYGNASNYEKEISYYLQARQIAEETGNLQLMSIFNGTLGRGYLSIKKTDSALITEKMAYDQSVQIGYIKYLGSFLLNLGRIYTAMGNKELATEEFRKALAASTEQNYLRGMVAGNLALADIYNQSGKRDSGLYFNNTALGIAQHLGAPSLLLRSYTALAAFYRKTGNNDSTVKYQELIIRINDSLFNSKRAQEFQNIDLDEQQRIQEKEAARRTYQYRLRLYGLLTWGGIFLLLAIILWRNNRHKQKAYSLLIRQKQETDFQKSKVEQTLKELETTQGQLVQREKMASLGELTAGIAHEIENPLNFVNNFAEINKELLGEMKEALLSDNKTEAITLADDIGQNIDKIITHGNRADAIVKGMLQHSRSSSGQKEPTDVNALAEEYLRMSYHGLMARDTRDASNKPINVTIKTNFDQSLSNVGERISIIPQDIGQVLLNLYNNAFYAVSKKLLRHPAGYEPTVALITKREGDRVELRVRDNGDGIPEKIINKIFQPFFTTKPAGQGTGLGLSLSYDIIKAHGGEIKIETKEGEYAEFIIQLPFALNGSG